MLKVTQLLVGETLNGRKIPLNGEGAKAYKLERPEPGESLAGNPKNDTPGTWTRDREIEIER